MPWVSPLRRAPFLRLVGATAASLTCLGLTLPAAATTGSPRPSEPPAFPCATELFAFDRGRDPGPSTPAGASTGTRPSVVITTPAPLPSVTSTVGGPRLAETAHPVTDLPDGVPHPPPSRVTAWLVADLTSGDVLAACNAHVPLAPASTLKVLTALALIDVVPPTAVYTATEQDAAVDGTRVGLVPGSRYTSDNLWHALLMSSGNDSAHALAELAGGQQRAAGLLQARAAALGAGDTRAVNTSGLDAPGQVSSALDLALFARAALADRRISSVASRRDYPFPDKGTALRGSDRTTFQIQNHNRLLAGYPGTTGLKNGWTSQAGGSFVGTATRDGRSYVAVVLRADTSVWQATTALLDWAFAAGGRARAVGTLNVPPVDVASPSTGASAMQSAMPSAMTSAMASAVQSGSPSAGSAQVPASPSPDARPDELPVGVLAAAAAGVLTLGVGVGLLRSRRARSAGSAARR